MILSSSLFHNNDHGDHADDDHRDNHRAVCESFKVTTAPVAIISCNFLHHLLSGSRVINQHQHLIFCSTTRLAVELWKSTPASASATLCLNISISFINPGKSSHIFCNTTLLAEFKPASATLQHCIRFQFFAALLCWQQS